MHVGSYLKDLAPQNRDYWKFMHVVFLFEEIFHLFICADLKRAKTLAIWNLRISVILQQDLQSILIVPWNCEMKSRAPRSHLVDVDYILIENGPKDFCWMRDNSQLENSILINGQSPRVCSFDQQKGGNVQIVTADSFMQGSFASISDLINQVFALLFHHLF